MKVLWPLIIKFITEEKYTGAVGIICKALFQAGQQQIAGKKDTFWIDFDIQVNLPKPNDIIARCFVREFLGIVFIDQIFLFRIGSSR